MEVADQWRRQWAGTAEYGKVTEGGITRRIARAMEVLHASGPGARVRVMRAAYHSSAGPGAPAESFMLHSSRRVISSGFNFLSPESPSLPIKPLEISSTPLEIAHGSNGETENYKVTEPDDFEISEPSKWRGSTRGSTIRMPSEESSSTDNASIIDLDSRNNRYLHRKYSYDSESSDVQFRSRSNSRNSQLLDAPTTLSTLKYKSLLNSSNEWNTRRKSYSFEDTSPLNETIIHNNATFAMESSTDSGICKSTELVNDHIDDNSHIKHFGNDEPKPIEKEESFKDWLTKNRNNSHYSSTKFKTYRDHDIFVEEPKENNIAVQSTGKLTITLPITIEGDHDNNPRNLQASEDIDKRIKKVEFCKTEVHFAAESGKVNIIATDDKPPPSNDFRKRRSAFVPMKEMIDRPITLFGEKSGLPVTNGVSTSFNTSNSDYSESDENTAATKSILKNKIPKPKPYLLGENMDFGILAEDANKNTDRSTISAVSLVNQQIESEKRYKGEIKSVFSETEKNIINSKVLRTINTGPTVNDSLKNAKRMVTNIEIEKMRDDIAEDIKNKHRSIKSSPTHIKPKTRQLRESDLTYFGIDNDRKTQHKIKPMDSKFSSDDILENIFHSVKLIQQVSNSVSNSVCNSEPESDDAPEYQNIPLNINFAPIPTPRVRSKYDDKSNEIAAVRAGLKPIIEKEGDEIRDDLQTSSRRTRIRKHEEVKASRSLSEPPKNFKRNSYERSSRRGLNSSNKEKPTEDIPINNSNSYRKYSGEDIPIYANLNIDEQKISPAAIRKHSNSSEARSKENQRTNSIKNKNVKKTVESISHKTEHRSDSGAGSGLRKKASVNEDTVSSSLKRETKAIRSEKSKSLYNEQRNKSNDDHRDNKYVKTRESNHKTEENNKSERHSRSLQKTVDKTTSENPNVLNHDQHVMHRDISSHRKRNKSEDKKTTRDIIKAPIKLDSDSTERYSLQMKSNDREKEHGSKHHHRSNKHREYVINYDDKNGTVSSICKIKTGLGTPRRKKTSKEILKDNHKENALSSKPVDKKIALRK